MRGMVHSMSIGSSPAPAAARRHRILQLLSQQALTTAELRARLDPEPSPRSLADDLRWLRNVFPGRVDCARSGRAHVHRFAGEVPRLLPTPLTHLDEDQVSALIAARGLLRTPDPTHPTAEDPVRGYHGALAQALDRLLTGAGLGDEARAIAPDAVSISRFGVAPEEEAAFPLCLAAIRTNGSIAATYTNLDGEVYVLHAKAVRLVHIVGEFHLLAWSHRRGVGKLRQYRLSRMTDVVRRNDDPPGCPHSGLRRDAADLLTDAFRATGSLLPADRITVLLTVSPPAWPFLERRRWGASQHWDHAPADLPPGWRRLRFTTTGLNEARYWILGFGSAIRAESPPALVEWIHDQARTMAEDAERTRQAKLPIKPVPSSYPPT